VREQRIVFDYRLALWLAPLAAQNNSTVRSGMRSGIVVLIIRW
jgi:hypothetical protein